MKAGLLLKWGFVATAVALAVGCSKNTGVGMDGNSASAYGLGQFKRFAGQEEGESYTTQAPHNQLYLFSYDNSILQGKYLPSLHAQAAWLKAHPGSRVLVAGHTDERGSREYNIALGEHRGNSVARILRMDGVNSNQIRVVSYGKERPINLGHSASDHAQNRRVEFIYEATK